MKNSAGLKIFITLTICTTLIFCFSYYGQLVYGKVFNPNELFALNTKIGPINISDMSEEEAVSKLIEEEDNWRKNAKLSLHYKEKESFLQLDIFKFENETSLKNAIAGKESPLFVTLDEKSLSNILTEISPELTSSELQIEQLKEDLLIYAAKLSSGNQAIKLLDYLSGQSEELVTESTTQVDLENKVLQKWVSEVPVIEIKSHSQFSMLKFIEENEMSSFDETTLSILASSIYRAVLSTNFNITERHISRELPRYSEAGFEAKIDQAKNMDFIVTNPNDQDYVLEFKYSDSLLNVSLKGSKFLYQYDVSVEDKELFKPKKIIQFDAKLPFGEVKKETSGKEGILVRVFREILDENGAQLRKELISEDFYPPIHEVVIQSLTMKDSPNSLDQSNLPQNNSQEDSYREENNENDSNKQDDSSEEDGSKLPNNEDGQVNNGNESVSDLWGKENEPKK